MLRGVIWPPQVRLGDRKMSAQERTHFDQTTELLQQYSRWIVLKLVEGKSPRRWVIRDPSQLQELVEKLAQHEPYGVKCYRENLDDEFECAVDYHPHNNDIFGQMFGSVRVMIAVMKAEVVEVTISSKGITLWIQQAFDRPELVHQAIAEY